MCWAFFLSILPVSDHERYIAILLIPVLLAFGLGVISFYRLACKADVVWSAVSLTLSMGLAFVLAVLIAMGTLLGELG
ncbi:hypothetical protein [Paenibacillus sp. NFR01]|uniref:hypothetical protein n=1 Tax=Paenibacillus sp. NFR01 TaxID=1566279 RepID=UPI000B878A86|nr:hypothetical protein [Paenibacillus sp. NFR01]